MATKKQDVQVLVEGNNRVVLVFPEGTDLKVRQKVSVADLAAVLRAPADEVEGQGRRVRTPTAIAGVRG
jgi:hypothetical protein